MGRLTLLLLTTLSIALSVAGCRSVDATRAADATVPARTLVGANLPTAEVLQIATFGADSFTIRDASVRVYSYKCVNRTSNAAYLQLYQSNDGGWESSAAWPGDAAVPVDQTLLPANGMVIVGDDFYSLAGSTFPNGLTWAVSSVAGTFANPGVTTYDCTFGVQ